MLVVVVLAVGLLVVGAANSFAQSPVGGESWLSQPEPTVYRPTADAFSVRATLDQFESGLALHDVGMLEAVGVKRVSAKGWRRFFRNNPEAKVTDNCPASDLWISGDTANWTCTETVTIISERKPRSFLHIIHFTFAKRNGSWMVAKRR